MSGIFEAFFHSSAIVQTSAAEVMQQVASEAAEEWENQTSVWKDLGQDLLEYLPKLIFAILLLVVCMVVSKVLVRLFSGVLDRSNRIEPTVSKFLKRVARIGLYAIAVIITLGALGVPTTTLITLLGTAGLAFSLALQNTLSNLAGGFLLMFSRPFKLGDFIEVDGISGTVKEIHIISTVLTTPDNKVISIPNGQVSGSRIINYNGEVNRRLDLTFSISYQDNVEQAKTLIRNIVAAHPLALQDPAPLIRLGEHGASSLNLIVRVWVPAASYWDLNFDLLEQVKEAFDKHQISIPYNQLDVHVHS